jgi:DNA-binding response OmpR family regulator
MTKVMIVDDDRTTSKLLQTLLELDGFEVFLVARGADVMTQAQAHTPDIFLMDYHLSDMDGVDIIRELRKTTQFATVPIVMVSGMEKTDEALAAGASDFLLKPFDPDELPPLFNKLVK